MNRFTLFVVAAAVALGTSLHVRSQAPVPAVPATPLEALQLIRGQNQRTIDQQNATLKRLEEIEKDAHQLRILARRV